MDRIKIFALGGLDENGKNLYVIDVNDEVILIEAGSRYPETDQLGVSEIICDYDYIYENKDRIKGIFITHAHDDVMGGLKYLIKQINIPIYTAAYTAALIRNSFKKNKVTDYSLHVIDRSGSLKLGNFKIRTFALTCSTFDNFGLAIETDQGYIVYTGEFIFDLDTASPHFASDIAYIADIGREKVFALLAESNGADREGYTSPRHHITSMIEPHIENAEARIIVSVYHQNLYRILEILRLAEKYRKRVYLYSNTIRQMLQSIEELGYYHFQSHLFVDTETYNNENDDDVIVLVTGIGQEVFARMMRIAINEDDKIHLKDTDTVIIASPASYETEVDGSKMKDELYRDNVAIVNFTSSDILTMHASSEDIKMMIYLFKPEYFIPIKGEYRQLVVNANIALDMGYRADHIVVLDNGQVASFEGHVLKSTNDLVDIGEVMIGMDSSTDVNSSVLKDREVLSQDGVIIIGVALNYNTKEIISGVDVQSRGLIYLKDADYIVREVGNILVEAITDAVNEGHFDNMKVRMDARDRISRYLLRETGKRPMILPAIVEINITE